VERNPTEGRHRAAGLYRTRPVTPTTSTPLYENASRLQLTPSTGHRFSLGLPARIPIWGRWRSLHQEYAVTQNQSVEASDTPSMTSVKSTFADWEHNPQRSHKLLQGLEGYPPGSHARPHGISTNDKSLCSSASAQIETWGLLSRVSIRDTLTDAHDESTRMQVEASDSTPPGRTNGHRHPKPRTRKGRRTNRLGLECR